MILAFTIACSVITIGCISYQNYLLSKQRKIIKIQTKMLKKIAWWWRASPSGAQIRSLDIKGPPISFEEEEVLSAFNSFDEDN